MKLYITAYVVGLMVALVNSAEPLFEPCNVKDIDCLRKATQDFLSKTYGGVPALGLTQVDPMIIPTLFVPVDPTLEVDFKFENLTVSGLKNLKIEDFQMHLDQQTATLQMKADIDIISAIEITLKKYSKSLFGSYSATASPIGTAKYPVSLQNINGTEYFVVGPESIACEIANEPVVKFGAELQKQINEDADAVNLQLEWERKQVEIRKKDICHIAGVAFKAIVQNLRTLATHLPKNAFFKDV